MVEIVKPVIDLSVREQIGVELEWPPKKIVRKIALIGTIKK